MRIVVAEQSVEVKLALWEKAFGLMGDLRVARADLGEVRVVENPVREAMGAGIKVGLRIPWLLFIARTIRLDQLFIVRRGVPALSFSVSNGGTLRRVLLSTPDAAQLAARLTAA